MVKRLILLIFLIVLVLASLTLSSEAEAGKYRLHVCNSYNNGVAPLGETWWSGPWSQANQGNCGASTAWTVAWGSTASIPNFAFGREGAAGARLTAPSGSYISKVTLTSDVRSRGSGARCTGVFGSNGLLIQGSQNCRNNTSSLGSTGFITRTVPGVSDSAVGIFAFCAFGPCGGTNHFFAANIRNMIFEITDSTKATVSAGAGLMQQNGWVRGSWPLSFSSSDGFGVRQHRAIFNGSEVANQDFCRVNIAPDGVYWGNSLSSCPGSATSDFTINTATRNGSFALQAVSTDLTGNVSQLVKTIKADNSAPQVLSISAQSTAATRTPSFIARAADSQSGIGGYFCKVDSGQYIGCASTFAIGPLANGQHKICAKVTNRSYDTAGAPLESAEKCSNWTVNAPSPPPTPSPNNPDQGDNLPPQEPGSLASDSDPDDGIKVSSPKIITTDSAVILQTTLSAEQAGTVRQVVVNRYGKRTVRCRVAAKEVGAGDHLLTCRMGQATRKALKKKGLTILLTTVFEANDGQLASEIDSLAIRRRP